MHCLSSNATDNFAERPQALCQSAINAPTENGNVGEWLNQNSIEPLSSIEFTSLGQTKPNLPSKC